jgi:hypothetical protein
MRRNVILWAALMASLLSATVRAGEQAVTPPQGGRVMTGKATGTFEVKVKPLPDDVKVQGVAVGRMSIDKVWSGDMVGTSMGEMMTASAQVTGSGGYVAVEMMKVSLKGRSGTFTLMHHATMKANADFKMLINVVPDSATGELTGLTGALTITIEPGRHSYVFDYTLPAPM